MGSSDTYHPKTVWMAQGATHLRCSSGAEIKIADGGKLRNTGDVITTGVAQSTTLSAYGTYVLDTSGVYQINPEKGSLATIHIQSTAKVLFKATSGTHNTRFPSSKRRVVKVWCTSALTVKRQPAFQVFGFSTDRAYIRTLAIPSSDLSNESVLAFGFSTTT